MSVDRPALLVRKACIEAEIQKLEVTERQLHHVLGEFNHGCRRVDDMLTRLGGRSVEFEQKQKLLQQNRKLTTDDLERNAAFLNDLRRQLAEITRKIEQLDSA